FFLGIIQFMNESYPIYGGEKDIISGDAGYKISVRKTKIESFLRDEGASEDAMQGLRVAFGGFLGKNKSRTLTGGYSFDRKKNESMISVGTGIYWERYQES